MLHWETRGRRFKSSRSDQYPRIFQAAFRAGVSAGFVLRAPATRSRLRGGRQEPIRAQEPYSTLKWLPTTELRLFEISDAVASHALINSEDGTRVRVRPQGEHWPVKKVKGVLKQG
jgi:hypothetical protein